MLVRSYRLAIDYDDDFYGKIHNKSHIATLQHTADQQRLAMVQKVI